MSMPASSSAVAIKGVSKRKRSSSGSDESPSDDEFKGCRDSPSPIHTGAPQRASKSRRQHHRVVIKTPLLHRQSLERNLEGLWKSHGVEYNFERSSFDASDMSYFGRSGDPSQSTASAATPAERIMAIQPLGSADRPLPSLQMSALGISSRASTRRATEGQQGAR